MKNKPIADNAVGAPLLFASGSVIAISGAFGAISETVTGQMAVVGIVGLWSLLTLSLLPVHTLPTIALSVILFVPDRLIDAAGFSVTTPSAIVLIFWAIRKAMRHSPYSYSRSKTHGHVTPRSVITILILFITWLIPHTITSPLPSFSLAWFLTFLTAVFIPLFVKDRRLEVALLRQSLPILTSIVAVYAIIQSIVQNNFLYNPLYLFVGRDSVQHWEVYRADASLGHPLTAGLIFAVGLAFAAGRWIETRRHVFLVACALQGLGLFLTVSRGSYVAAGLAVTFLVFAAMLAGRQFGRARAFLLIIGFASFIAYVLQSDAFVKRTTSDEALASTEARNNLLQIALDAINSTNWLGGGLAASSVIAAPFNFQGLPIENSYLQLIIGIGLPGFLLFAILLTLAIRWGYRYRTLASASALVAFAVAISGYSAIDTILPLVALFGLLLMMATTDLRRTASGSRCTDGINAGDAHSIGSEAVRHSPVPLSQ